MSGICLLLLLCFAIIRWMLWARTLACWLGRSQDLSGIDESLAKREILLGFARCYFDSSMIIVATSTIPLHSTGDMSITSNDQSKQTLHLS